VVIDPASLLVDRRAKRAKTDRIDARAMVRALMAWARGERQVLSEDRVPTVEQDDARRGLRERQRLVKERSAHGNRIKGLLKTQGIMASIPVTRMLLHTVIEWLFWQVGGLGPMAGQNHHFGVYAPEKIPYAIDRYVKETNRLYGVMDRRLAGRRFLAAMNTASLIRRPIQGVVPWKRQQRNLDDFVNLRRWFDCIHDRPGTRRAYAKGEPFSAQPAVTEEGKKLLFGQTVESFVKA
jgi:hypothetical protein